MNEVFKYIGVSIIALLIGAAAGALVVGYLTGGELARVEDNLREANAESDQLRENYQRIRGELEEAERIAERRQERNRKLTEAVERLESRLEEREAIVRELEGQIESIGGDAGEIGELAKRGRAIVERLLSQAEARPP